MISSSNNNLEYTTFKDLRENKILKQCPCNVNLSIITKRINIHQYL